MIDKNAHIEISDQTGSFYRRKMLSNNGLLSGIVLVAAIGLCSAVIADKINMYLLHVLIFSIIWAIFAIGWNLAAGFAGIKAFGHQAFFAIGAYSSSLLSMALSSMSSRFSSSCTGWKSAGRATHGVEQLGSWWPVPLHISYALPSPVG